MLIKAGVDISRLNREIRRALPKIQEVLRQFHEELVITSTYEGTHGEGSLHYCNDAIDLKGPKVYLGPTKEDLKVTLGKDYDVVLERDHIHVEYDPK